MSTGRPTAFAITEYLLLSKRTRQVLETDAGTAWTIKAQYASAVTSAWKVNANGQTYGVPNESGVPDLSAAQATNGEVGYILQDELWGFAGDKGFINVYESDGTTVIGQFPIGDN